MTQFIQLDTTNSCNLRCSFCYKGENNPERIYFMSISELKEIFESNSDISGVSLVNSGEFFMHPEWRDILLFIFEIFRERSVSGLVSLNTNGFFMNKENAICIKRH